MNPQLEALLALVRRYPWAVACTVVALLSGGGAWFLHGDIADLAQPYAQSARDYEDMLNLTKGGRTQREELETVREITRRIDENLLIEANLVDNNWYFYKFEEQSKAHLLELHQLNSPPTDTSPLFRRVPYTLRVTGTFEQVATFLLTLETGPRLAKITAFTISRSTGKDSSGGRGGDASADTSATAAATNVVLDLSLELLGKK